MSKMAFLFPGQGSQFVGMGKSLWELSPTAKEIFEEANDALGYDLKKLCFEGGIEELTKTENTQPAILTVSVAAYRVYMQEIGNPADFLAGHSLGEYSALCCSGALRFSDAVRLVRKRGQFMQEAAAAGSGAMAAVGGVSRTNIEAECARISQEGKTVVISNYNSPSQFVLSGHTDAVKEAGEIFARQGARVVPLQVSAPFHSPLMQSAADQLKEELHRIAFQMPERPVLSNVTALPYTGIQAISENLTEQIVRPVQWIDSMAYLVAQGVNTIIEMGPKTVLKNLMAQNATNVRGFSFENREDLSTLKHAFSTTSAQGSSAGNGVDLLTRCIAAAVCTRNTNWDNEQYQHGVVEPYQKLVSMKDAFVKEKGQPENNQMRQALEWLKLIFMTKGVSLEEQTERFTEILKATETSHIFAEYITGTQGIQEKEKVPVLQG